jgi:putative flippase GtrA
VLRRQVPLYLVIGLVQLAIDAALFIAFTAAGMPVAPANVVARASAALLGFALNGRYTFQSADQPWRVSRSLPRFLAIWCGLTALGTVAVSTVDARGSLGLAWAAKPLIDALLAAAGFFASRRWIYR